ncbi:MAG: Helix-turn-helix domain protein [Candidatus Bathyarchaeota archaeon BA1]|nr:MAG: Helix-turn-helix domain protein [Candidatus Bathyarchaeota archaeon BA1]
MLRLADDVKESLSLRSAHEILELLSIWKSVSVRELCEFTGYSRNQVYQALSKLVEAGLVRKRGAGVFELAEDELARRLADVYRYMLVRELSTKVLTLLSSIKGESPVREAVLLMRKYEPIFKSELKWAAHSLAEYIGESSAMENR